MSNKKTKAKKTKNKKTKKNKTKHRNLKRWPPQPSLLFDTCLKFDQNRIFFHTSVKRIVDIMKYGIRFATYNKCNDLLVNVVSYNANRATFTEAL